MRRSQQARAVSRAVCGGEDGQLLVSTLLSAISLSLRAAAYSRKLFCPSGLANPYVNSYVLLNSPAVELAPNSPFTGASLTNSFFKTFNAFFCPSIVSHAFVPSVRVLHPLMNLSRVKRPMVGD